MIGARLEELVDEIAVGGMDLDAVESGSARPSGGDPVILDRGHDLLAGKRPRRLVGLLPLRRVDALAGHRDRRRGDGQFALVVIAVRRAPHVPELEEDLSPGGVDGVGDPPPACLHGAGIDPGGLDPAVALRRDRRRLGDDQPCRGPLDVILAHQIVGDPLGAGTGPRQGGHDDPVGQGDVVERVGIEKRRHGGSRQGAAVGTRRSGR